MTTKAIREKLLAYIASADDKKVKAMYVLLEAEIDPPAEEKEEEFWKEMDRRSKEMKDGTAKTYSWEEAKEIILNESAKPYGK